MASGEVVVIDDKGAHLSDHLTPEELDFLSAYMRLMKMERIGFDTALAIVWSIEAAKVDGGSKQAD